jgi:hypothetical protein
MHPYGESKLADRIHKRIFDLLLEMHKEWDREKLEIIEYKMEKYLELYGHVLNSMR